MISKPLRIWFKKIDRFTKIYDGIRYLVLCGPESYDAIYNRIGYLISEKVTLQILLIIILQDLELIHIILYL